MQANKKKFLFCFSPYTVLCHLNPDDKTFFVLLSLENPSNWCCLSSFFLAQFFPKLLLFSILQTCHLESGWLYNIWVKSHQGKICLMKKCMVGLLIQCLAMV